MTWWLPWHPDWQINAGVLLLALVLDIALPEPPNVFHPVAWMGKVISWMERLTEGLRRYRRRHGLVGAGHGGIGARIVRRCGVACGNRAARDWRHPFSDWVRYSAEDDLRGAGAWTGGS